MDTTIKNAAPSTAVSRSKYASAKVPSVDTKATAPESVQTPQAVEAAGKPATQQTAPSAPLTTYKDQDSGRLIVRVYDRKNGDILVEFPPEKAFRSVEDVLRGVGKNPKKIIFV